MTGSSDRTIGGELDMIIRTAISRSRRSLSLAEEMSAAGFHTSAFVWAVRSIEIFVKEVMLLPYFFEQTGGDFGASFKKAQKGLGASSWGRAMQIVDEQYGPLDPMVTDDGNEVWTEWKAKVVRRRGDFVHGVADAEQAEAELAITWAEMMMTQLTLRLIAAKRHPLHDLFVAVLISSQAQKGIQESETR
ncbi:MAG: hypothetical protein ACYC1I_09695 [Acidimicrobiales bacterium]